MVPPATSKVTWPSRVGQLAQGVLWGQKRVSKARGCALWRFWRAGIGGVEWVMRVVPAA